MIGCSPFILQDFSLQKRKEHEALWDLPWLMPDFGLEIADIIQVKVQDAGTR
jgi:hypothetical protein